MQLLRTDARLGPMGPALADLLTVTLAILEQQSSESGRVLAAHGMRELIEKVGLEFHCTVRVDKTTLKDKVNNLRVCWAGWGPSLSHYADDKAKKNLQAEFTATKALRKMADFLKATEADEPNAATRLLHFVVKSGGELSLLSEAERKSTANQLDMLYDEFTQISHLRKTPPPLSDFRAMVDRCIDMLSMGLLPATFLGLQELDGLIEQVESK